MGLRCIVDNRHAFQISPDLEVEAIIIERILTFHLKKDFTIENTLNRFITKVVLLAQNMLCLLLSLNNKGKLSLLLSLMIITKLEQNVK